MKKLACLCLMLGLMTMSAGCVRVVPDSNELVYFTTFGPAYLLTAEIARDVPGVSTRALIQPQDGCPRLYALSDWDKVSLADASALVFSGGGLENFDSQGLPAVYAAAPAALDEEESHFSSDEAWRYLDPSGLRDRADAVAAGLAALDPSHEAVYARNAKRVDARLEALTDDLANALASVRGLSVGVLHEGMSVLAEAFGLRVAAVVEREAGASLSDNEWAAALPALRDAGVSVVLIERQAPDALLDQLDAAGFRAVRVDTLIAQSAPTLTDYERALREAARETARAFFPE